MTISITINAATPEDLQKQLRGLLTDVEPIPGYEGLNFAARPKADAKPKAAAKVEKEAPPLADTNAASAQPAASEEPEDQSSSQSGPEVSSSASTAEPTLLEGEQPIPYSDVSDAVIKLSVKHGRDAVLALLAHFGAEKKASEIEPARFGEVLEYIAEKMAD